LLPQGAKHVTLHHNPTGYGTGLTADFLPRRILKLIPSPRRPDYIVARRASRCRATPHFKFVCTPQPLTTQPSVLTKCPGAGQSLLVGAHGALSPIKSTRDRLRLFPGRGRAAFATLTFLKPTPHPPKETCLRPSSRLLRLLAFKPVQRGPPVLQPKQSHPSSSQRTWQLRPTVRAYAGSSARAPPSPGYVEPHQGGALMA